MKEYNNIEKIIQKAKNMINEINKEIIEKRNKLEKETENQNLINILKNRINNCEESMNILNDWIRKINV